MSRKYLNDKNIKQLEFLLSHGVSFQVIPTKDDIRIRQFHGYSGKSECHLDSKRIELIEKILSSGCRVELEHVNGHIRVLQIRRKEVKPK